MTSQLSKFLNDTGCLVDMYSLTCSLLIYGSYFYLFINGICEHICSLLPVDHIIKHKPPDVPPPQVSLELQSINKLFRVVIERMSKLSKNLHIVAYQSGKLILATSQQINLKVKTYFTDVTPRYDTFEPVSGMNIMETYNQNVAEVKLDIKKLSTVLLFFNSIPYTNVIGFFSTNEMLVINIELAPLGLGTVTYFIPVIVLSEEEEEDSSEEED